MDIMNIQQLKVFREVMKSGSLNGAAKTLHRSQPAITASLKNLENSLDIVLFKREGRRLVPRPEAHYLLTEAVEILDRCRTTQQNIALMRERVQGSIRIVSMPGPSSFLLPNFISKYVAQKADVKIAIATRSSPHIRSLMSSQTYDIGFCDIDFSVADSQLFNSMNFTSECVCALPIDHPLAAEAIITPTHLNNVPMGSLHSEVKVVQNIKAAFYEQGANFNVRFTAQYFIPLLEYVAAGQACVVLDKLSARGYELMQQRATNKTVIFRPFAPATTYSIGILTPLHLPISLVAEDFLHNWQQYVEDILAEPL
jgi:DNA-binding transcriptional LysR family regulator